MKKHIIFICAMSLVFGIVRMAGAVPYVEEYSGYEAFYSGDTEYFGFDFWYENDVRNVGTTSHLDLVQDAAGAFGEYESGSLSVGFYSEDEEAEYADIDIMAFNSKYELIYSFDRIKLNLQDGDSTKLYDIDLPQVVLDALEIEGGCNVRIIASWICGNDFAIEKVGMEVNTGTAGTPTPEPATVVLFGFGLIGLAGFKKKFRKS